MNEEYKEGFAPLEQNETDVNINEDYIFRFPLEPEKIETVYDDPLLEMVRGLLADLLDCVILTYKGKRVRVDGFRLLQDLDTQYEIFPKKKDDDLEQEWIC